MYMKASRSRSLITALLGWCALVAASPFDSAPTGDRQTALDAVLGQSLPGEEICLPDSQVADRFYSYLIGLVSANVCGVVDAEQLCAILEKRSGKTAIPFTLVDRITRDCAPHKGARDVSITFTDDLKTPVPYDILGYHPGSVAASKTVDFREWYLPRQKIPSGGGGTIDLTNVFVFGVSDGWAVVDIDAWVDKLLGGYLDDTRIVLVVLFKYQNQWHGLAGGYGPSGEGRSGIFNFQTNMILFPTPEELRGVAGYFRNFVIRDQHVNAPLPPSDQWKPAKLAAKP